MSFMSAMEIISSGLSASRFRMNMIASNLANAQTTRTPEGGPYRRRDPIYRSAPVQVPFADQLRDRLTASFRGVEVSGVAMDQRPPRTVHDPGHPDADANGIVKMPNVNVVEEMVDMITASRAYEAGVTAMQTIKSMASKALSIGR